jgi:hypothetical protein
VERSKGLAADATAAVASAVGKAQSSEAVAKAGSQLRGFFNKAAEKTGDVLNAAKAKVEQLNEQQGAPATARQ